MLIWMPNEWTFFLFFLTKAAVAIWMAGVQGTNYAYWKNPHTNPSLIRIKHVFISASVPVFWHLIKNSLDLTLSNRYLNPPRPHLMVGMTCRIFTVQITSTTAARGLVTVDFANNGSPTWEPSNQDHCGSNNGTNNHNEIEYVKLCHVILDYLCHISDSKSSFCIVVKRNNKLHPQLLYCLLSLSQKEKTMITIWGKNETCLLKSMSSSMKPSFLTDIAGPLCECQPWSWCGIGILHFDAPTSSHNIRILYVLPDRFTWPYIDFTLWLPGVTFTSHCSYIGINGAKRLMWL